MNNNSIKFQKSKADKMILVAELYLESLKEYRNELDKDTVKGYDGSVNLFIDSSITGKLKHLGVICRKEMISFEKIIRTIIWEKK